MKNNLVFSLILMIFSLEANAMDTESSIYVIASGIKARMKELDYLANESSKIDVTGHKREKFIYDQYDINNVSYSQNQDIATYRDVSDGGLKITKEPLDLAIRGDAYFSFETPNGKKYGRAGHLTINAEGAIVDLNGYRLLDANEQPIIIDNGTIGLVVKSNGLIVSRGEEVQQIGIFTFVNTQLMAKEGQNLYSPGINPLTNQPQAEILAENAQIVQGALEMSNVNRVDLMSNLIEAQRSIGLMTTIVASLDALEKNSIQTLLKNH